MTFSRLLACVAAASIAIVGCGGGGGGDQPSYTIGGTVAGLTGSGLILHSSIGDDLPVSTSGRFAFPTLVRQGSAYAVTVKQQPSSPAQVCSVSSGIGTVGAGNVSNVTVTCVAAPPATFTVGGTASGVAGTGLVLQNNGGDDLAIHANGPFTFASSALAGTGYAVTVKSQPTSPAQICAVTNGSGTVASANVTSVTVTCETIPTFTIGGAVQGLAGGSLVLQNNAGDDLTVAADGTFTFATALQSGAAYAVTVKSKPASQSCVVANGTGTVASSAVANVSVTCAAIPPNSYPVGGLLSGLGAGKSVTLRNNGVNTTVTSNGTYVLATQVAAGAPYAVTVATQPLGQTCTVANATGTIASSAVTNVNVACTTNSYTVGGSVAGLVSGGTLVLQNNAGDDRTITSNGSFTFATAVLSGQTYAVTVKSKPATQNCTVTNGTGAVGGTAVTNVTVTCTTPSYSIGGTMTGLPSGGTVVLQNNAADDLSVSANGTFTFATAVASGQPYAVTVKSTPATHSCTVTNGTGNVASGPVTNVTITCSNTVAVQRWQAPTSWGALWPDEPSMVQHAYFESATGSDTVITETKGINWGLANPLPPPTQLPLGSVTRVAAGPFDAAHYQATTGDAAIDLAGDITVCAVVKPDFNPLTAGEKVIFANGTLGSGWVLMQRHWYFSFAYQNVDADGHSQVSDVVYAPSYFADGWRPDSGPLNPALLVVCGGRAGESIYVGVNRFPTWSAFVNGFPLSGPGPHVAGAVAQHAATIGGYETGAAENAYGGRVYETAVWNEAATPANIQRRMAQVQGLLFSAADPTPLTYTRNHEALWLGTDGAYRAAGRHSQRVDPEKGLMFGLHGWNHLSACFYEDGTPLDCLADTSTRFAVTAFGEELDLWTKSAGASVTKDQSLPPIDVSVPSAEHVALAPSASISTPVAAFDGGGRSGAGPIHGQIWLRIGAAVPAGRTVRFTTTNPVSGGTSAHDVDLHALTPGAWTHVWLKGLTTDGAAGTFTMEAPASNSGAVEFDAWGANLAQISGGGDLGDFDPGPLMYDWSASASPGWPGLVDQPVYGVDMLELPPVSGSTTSTGFCLSVDAQPYAGLSWTAPFTVSQGIAIWIDGASPHVATARLFLPGKAWSVAHNLCFQVTSGSSVGTACWVPDWQPGSKHTIRGCVAADGTAARLYADGVQVATAPFGGTTPNAAGGHVVLGNMTSSNSQEWATIGSPYFFNGYISKAVVCRDVGSAALASSCN